VCKQGNLFSLAALIGRGLDHRPWWLRLLPFDSHFFTLFSFQGTPPFYIKIVQSNGLYFFAFLLMQESAALPTELKKGKAGLFALRGVFPKH
jgi:hypothetical protein